MRGRGVWIWPEINNIYTIIYVEVKITLVPNYQVNFTVFLSSSYWIFLLSDIGKEKPKKSFLNKFQIFTHNFLFSSPPSNFFHYLSFFCCLKKLSTTVLRFEKEKIEDSTINFLAGGLKFQNPDLVWILMLKWIVVGCPVKKLK